MGPEMIVPLLMTAGGTVMQMQAQEDEADQRRAVLNQQLQRDDKAAEKAAELVQQEGKNFDPLARQQAMQDQEQRTFQASQADLQGAGGGMVNTSAGNANVSEDFLRDKAQRTADETERLTGVARAAAKTRAPGLLTTADSMRRADLASNLQNIFGSNRNMANATSLDAQSVEMPAYGALGGLASSLGNSMLSSNVAKAIKPTMTAAQHLQGIDFSGMY